MNYMIKKMLWAVALVGLGIVGGVSMCCLSENEPQKEKKVQAPKNYPSDEKMLQAMLQSDMAGELRDAVLNGNLRMALRLAERQKAALRRQDAQGNTLLHLAAMAGNPNMVYVLRHAGVNPLTKNNAGKLPSDLARGREARLACKYAEMMRRKELDAINAASVGNEAAVLKMINEGVSPNAESEQKNDTLLSVAVSKGTRGMVQALLRAGADLNRRYSDNRTLLHVVAGGEHPENTDLILQAGVSPFLLAYHDSTPLHNAIWGRKNKAVDLLIPYYKSMNYTPLSSGIVTPIELCIDRNYWYGFNALIKAGLDLNSNAFADCPLLVRATRASRADMVELLLRHGADKNARDKDGKRAVDYANDKIKDLLQAAP